MNDSVRLFSVMVACSVAGACAGVQYSVKDLGTLGSGASTAYGLNNAGHVVGTADGPGGRRAFLYAGGVMTDLGTFGGANSAAYSINDSGQIVGFANTSGNIAHAFFYSAGTKVDLGTMGEESSIASSINAAGQIVGRAGLFKAFYCFGGTMIDLGHLGGGIASAAAINASGTIVGSSAVTGATHAFVKTTGAMVDLKTLGGKNSYGRAINDLGQIVGESELTTGAYRHAYLVSGGVMTDLGAMGGKSSYAMDINNSSEIVGYAGVFGGVDHAFINIGGVNADLNYLLDSTGGAYEIQYAYAINESGQIVGEALHYTGFRHAVLLTPDNVLIGAVTLQDYTGAKTRPCDFTLLRPNGSVQETWSSPLGDSGYFYRRFTSAIGAGTYRLRIKVDHWLATEVPFTFATASNISASVVNGDVDGDNVVGLFDYLILSDAFDATEGDPNWDERADLDGDGVVSLFDYLILSDHFDESGA